MVLPVNPGVENVNHHRRSHHLDMQLKILYNYKRIHDRGDIGNADPHCI